jgi:regulator of sirC expression with transglutaminase-like and TPR domain
VVREAVINEIKAAGDEGLLWLEVLTKNKNLASHAKSLLSNLRTSELAARHFIEHIKSGIQDLEEACLLFERVIHPTLADKAYDEELDHLAERTRQLITEPVTVQDKCRLLCRVIFGEEGYRGAQESFSKPDSSLLSTVIKSHRGIPISLCLIFLLVAQRLSLPVQPVGLPGRFMVGIFKNKNPIYIHNTINEVVQLVHDEKDYYIYVYLLKEDIDKLIKGSQLPTTIQFITILSHFLSKLESKMILKLRKLSQF